MVLIWYTYSSDPVFWHCRTIYDLDHCHVRCCTTLRGAIFLIVHLWAINSHLKLAVWPRTSIKWTLFCISNSWSSLELFNYTQFHHLSESNNCSNRPLNFKCFFIPCHTKSGGVLCYTLRKFWNFECLSIHPSAQTIGVKEAGTAVYGCYKILRKNPFLHQSRAITMLFINEFSPLAIPNHSSLISMSMQSFVDQLMDFDKIL